MWAQNAQWSFFLCNYFAVVYASLLSLLMLNVTFVCALKVAL